MFLDLFISYDLHQESWELRWNMNYQLKTCVIFLALRWKKASKERFISAHSFPGSYQFMALADFLLFLWSTPNDHLRYHTPQGYLFRLYVSFSDFIHQLTEVLRIFYFLFFLYPFFHRLFSENSSTWQAQLADWST